jgi:hypothetical protein
VITHVGDRGKLTQCGRYVAGQPPYHGGGAVEEVHVAQKNLVVHSFNLDGETRCVDIFRRPDGTYGFEEYRREPEDGRGWFAIGTYSSRSFDTESDAVANARASIRWLASAIENR